MRLTLAALAASVIAQATPGVPDEIGRWVNFGALGLLTLGWLTGKIRRGADYDAMVAKNERYEEASTRVLLTLDKANDALKESNRLLARLVEDRRE